MKSYDVRVSPPSPLLSNALNQNKTSFGKNISRRRLFLSICFQSVPVLNWCQLIALIKRKHTGLYPTMDLEAHFIWGIYIIIFAYVHMNFIWTSYEINLSFISILYELQMNLSWVSKEICTGRHMWMSCKFHMKFIWSLYLVCVKFTCVFLYKFLVEFMTSSHEVYIELIWNS